MTIPQNEMADAKARRRILNDFATTLFVEAAAGTGKTTALVGRIVALICSGITTLDRIVAVAFTEKAAGEMKLRLRAEIERARNAEDLTAERSERLAKALSQLELARIGTIHAFCGDLLRERPIEAGIDPLFEVAAEDQAADQMDRAFDTWFQNALADPPEGVRRILRRRSRSQTPRDALRNAATNLVEHRDFLTAWRRDSFNRANEIDELIRGLSDVAELGLKASWAGDRLAQNLCEIKRFIDENARLETVRGRDYDGLEAAFVGLARFRSWAYKGAKRTAFGNVSRDGALARRDSIKAKLDAFLAKSNADLAPLLQEALRPALTAYEELKARGGRLDFLDLLIKARDLIRDNRIVREELQQRFTHYFVDEFQDTDPIQAELLLLLSADNPDENDWLKVKPIAGKLFFVGDPKQSIYRFRRADVAIYLQVKQMLLSRGAQPLYLNTSFRSPPSLQSFVNAAFAPVMTGGAAHGQYVPLEKWRPEITGRPTIVALPVPRPYGDYGTIVNFRIDESLPEATGAFVDWLVNQSGWTVGENGQAVPITARHICILFRRFRNFSTDVTRPYVRALEAHRLPHVLVGGRSFHDREEIIALRNALGAIEWPDDELRVYATLRGPLFAFSDDTLFAYRQTLSDDGELQIRRLHPMHPVARSKLKPVTQEVADALDLLGGLHVARNRRSIAQTILMLLDAVRAHAGIAMWPTGEQALANCLRMVDLARRFEQRGASSFRAFVERMDDDAEAGQAEDAPIVEQGTEGVRMMTVHRAKGLEFPVVILADPTCPMARDTPSRHIDPSRKLWLEPLCGCTPIELLEAAQDELLMDEAEAVRLAYVAATRARDLLVVPACGDRPLEGWLEVLNPALLPADDARRQSEPVPGAPAFGEDSVVDRGPQGMAPDEGSIRPGLHRPHVGAHTVAWWDPNVLGLETEENVGLRQQRILEADESGTEVARGQQAYSNWIESRSAALAQASRPSIKAQTVTAFASAADLRDPGLARVQLERITRADGERPGGRRFGALVHAVLATVDLDATADEIGAVAKTNARLMDATSEETNAAVTTVRDALKHPLIQRAAIAQALRRETPVQHYRADGTLIEGVVDLAFQESTPEFTGWIVVDFKTDREIETAENQYRAQIAAYVEAVSTATASPTRGFLLVL
jgi:ATP-dependent exoDNAse (exonuclease V) beta subunit